MARDDEEAADYERLTVQREGYQETQEEDGR
jgi:hypothetical protein